jgi:hypothetical protein
VWGAFPISPATNSTGLEQFKAKVVRALRRLHKMPALVRAFSSDPDLGHSEVAERAY